MESPNTNRTLYPDEVESKLMDEHEFLLAVEATVSIATAENPGQSERDLAIIFHLGVLCYIQGVQLAVENLKRYGKLNDQSISHVERQVMSILCAQTRWEFAETYCKTMLNVQISPIGLLIVLKHIANDNTSESDAALAEAVEQASHILEEKAKGELASVKRARFIGTDHPLIKADAGLVREFFTLLEEIGTFYMDRDKYETDEQKELHDRIVAVYQKITE